MGRFKGRSFVQLHTNWGICKICTILQISYKFIQVRLYEFVQISHLLKYVQIAIGLDNHICEILSRL